MGCPYFRISIAFVCLFVWILHHFPPYWLYQGAPVTVIILKQGVTVLPEIINVDVSLISKEIDRQSLLRFNQGSNPQPPSPNTNNLDSLEPLGLVDFYWNHVRTLKPSG